MGVRVGRTAEAGGTPIWQMGNAQIKDYMEHGGSLATLVQGRQAREGAQDASAAGQRATLESLAAGGLTGTPYEAALLGEQKMRGGFAASQAERDAVLQYFQNLPQLMRAPTESIAPFLGVPNAALGQPGRGDSGLGGLYAGLGVGAAKLGLEAYRAYYPPTTPAGAGAGAGVDAGAGAGVGGGGAPGGP
jgi:hypothetical protein